VCERERERERERETNYEDMKIDVPKNMMMINETT
jgi:hypothetical protein